MAGGGKRGRGSSGTDSSGRGGKRRAGLGSGSGSGKDKEKVDPVTKKLNEALRNASMLSTACNQTILSDVPNVRWELMTDNEDTIESSYVGLKKVLDERRSIYKRVMSVLIKGVVVTQPTSNETYHTVDVVVDDLGWDSGYSKIRQVQFGKGIISNIINCLRQFTPENCTLESYGVHNRVVLLESLMVFFGECGRSGVFLEFARLHYEGVNLVRVTKELKKHSNSWSNLSKAVMALYLGYLQEDHGQNGWRSTVEYGKQQIDRELGEFAALGHNSIQRFIVYEVDADGKSQLNYRQSLQNLLGSDVDQLLHLIKYNELAVQDIHLTRMKHGMKWPVFEMDD
ncbi:unnamed protein product [Alopecurus aequalis]